MPGFLLIVLGAIGVITACVIVALVRRPDPADPENPTANLTATWRAVGILLGIILAVFMLGFGELGVGPMLAPAALGLGVLSGILIGELQVKAPDAPQRTAQILPRTTSDYVPVALGRAVVAVTATLVVLMTITTAAGSPDDMGRDGRWLTFATTNTSASNGPWPGSYYTVPLAVALLIAGLITVIVLRRVTLRPRAGETVVDEAIRRRSAQAVTAGWGLTVGFPLVGFSITASSCLFANTAGPAWWTVASWVLLAVALGGLAVALWCIATLIVPARRFHLAGATA